MMGCLPGTRSVVADSAANRSAYVALTGGSGIGRQGAAGRDTPWIGTDGPGTHYALTRQTVESKELRMPPLSNPPIDLPHSRALTNELEQETSSGESAPPDSLRQLAEWRAQALARRSFGPPQSARRKKR
jgi:hypothetical protein